MGVQWSRSAATNRRIERQEKWEDSPEGYSQTEPYKWWHWHDASDDPQSSQWSSVSDRGLELQGLRDSKDSDAT